MSGDRLTASGSSHACAISSYHGAVALPSLYRPTVIRSARAKVNLALSVGAPLREGPRSGYHPIASWMARIDLADELMVTRLEDDRLSRYAILWHADAPRTSPIDWSITKDLAVRAHLLLEEETGRSLPVQLKLDKRIPVGGGLGGGSADAAAMLLAVRELFDLAIPDSRMVELAMKLGSDVAFCLEEGPAVVAGLGERIERTPAVEGWIVLVMPPFGCPTGAVYRAFDEVAGEAEAREEEVRAMARGAGAGIEGLSLFNDLAAAAERVAPELGLLRAQIARALGRMGDSGPRAVHVTGSGSTCFVVCGSAAHAAETEASLRRALEGCAVRAAKIG